MEILKLNITSKQVDNPTSPAVIWLSMPIRDSEHENIGVFHKDGAGWWIGWDHDSDDLAEFTKLAYPDGEGYEAPYKKGDVLRVYCTTSEGVHHFGGMVTDCKPGLVEDKWMWLVEFKPLNLDKTYLKNQVNK